MLTRRFWSLDPVKALVPGRARVPRLSAAEPKPESDGGTTRRWFLGALGLATASPRIVTTLFGSSDLDLVLVPEGLVEAVHYGRLADARSYSIEEINAILSAAMKEFRVTMDAALAHQGASQFARISC